MSNPMRKTKWHVRVKCSECGHHERLPHADWFFAPDFCPGCGEDGTLSKVRMRKRYKETPTVPWRPSTWGREATWEEK